MPYTKVTVTGVYRDPSGAPGVGAVEWAPTSPVTDTSGHVISTTDPIVVTLDNTGTFTVQLIPMDATGLSAGWAWQMTPRVRGIPGTPQAFSVLAANGLSQTLDSLGAAEAVPQYAQYLPLAGGTMTGTAVLAGSPALRIPAGAANGDLLTSDGTGNASWQTPQSGSTFTQPFTGQSVVHVSHGLGKYPSVMVFDTADDVCMGDVAYVDLNNLTVSFSAPFSGTVTCN